jgi:hypothetical protein
VQGLEAKRIDQEVARLATERQRLKAFDGPEIQAPASPARQAASAGSSASVQSRAALRGGVGGASPGKQLVPMINLALAGAGAGEGAGGAGGAGGEGEAGTEAEARAGAQTVAGTETQTEAEAQTEARTEADTKARTETEAGAEAEAAPKARGEALLALSDVSAEISSLSITAARAPSPQHGGKAADVGPGSASGSVGSPASSPRSSPRMYRSLPAPLPAHQQQPQPTSHLAPTSLSASQVTSWGLHELPVIPACDLRLDDEDEVLGRGATGAVKRARWKGEFFF